MPPSWNEWIAVLWKIVVGPWCGPWSWEPRSVFIVVMCCQIFWRRFASLNTKTPFLSLYLCMAAWRMTWCERRFFGTMKRRPANAPSDQALWCASWSCTTPWVCRWVVCARKNWWVKSQSLGGCRRGKAKWGKGGCTTFFSFRCSLLPRYLPTCYMPTHLHIYTPTYILTRIGMYEDRCVLRWPSLLILYTTTFLRCL